MKIISALKALPVASLLIMGIVLSPAIAMADNGDRGRTKSEHSFDSGQSHNVRDRHRDKSTHKKQQNERHIVRKYDRNSHGHNKYRHGHVIQKHNGKPYAKHKKHVYYHYDQHGQNHKPHHHDNYIVHHHEHYDVFDDVRFKIGIHTGDFDIVYRD